MAENFPKITDAEWAVLQLLWQQGPATVRQLTDVLYPRGGPSEYATVHKLLERLQAKHYVERQRKSGVYVFQAAIDRDEMVGREFDTLVERLCGGSLQALLSNLVRVKRVKPEELRDLLDLVDDLDKRSNRQKKPRS
jgi:BlaI family transcriptional regulator, penicillinase repressor